MYLKSERTENKGAKLDAEEHATYAINTGDVHES